MNIPVIDKSKTAHGFVAIDGGSTYISFIDYVIRYVGKTLIIKTL